MSTWKYKICGVVILVVLGVIVFKTNANTPTIINSEIEDKPSLVEPKQNATPTHQPEREGLPVLPRVLLAAGGCESNGGASNRPKQFNLDGSVVRHVNGDGSIDYGAFQINSIHLAEAKKLGLDFINSETDNYKMALWIYKTQGITAWKGYNASTGNCTYYETK